MANIPGRPGAGVGVGGVGVGAGIPGRPVGVGVGAGVGAGVGTGKTPLVGGTKKLLTDKSSVPTARPLQSGSIDLPLLAPTGPSAGVRSTNRQSPPPLPLPAFPETPVPQIPSSFPVSIRVNPNVKDPINAALAGASDGAEIIVPAGDYKESLKIQKNVHFKAEGTVRILSDSIVDVVNASADLITFKGFTFRQDESQSSGAAIVNTGSIVFRDCQFFSHYMSTIIVKSEAKAFLIDCSVECSETTTFLGRESSYTYCENVKFSSGKSHCVMIREKSTAKFVKCTIGNCARNAFNLMDHCKFLIENFAINKPFDITSQSPFGMIRGCTIDDIPLKVHGAATIYVVGCTFNRCSLECYETCGVRICDSNFFDQPELPGLVSHGDSTVETHNCTYKRCKSGAAAAVYKNGELKDNDGKFLDLCGIGAFATGNSTLELNHTAIVNTGNGGVVVTKGAQLKINESLIDRINGAGVVLSHSGKAEVAGSQISHCVQSGVEADSVDTLNVDHCIITENNQCGLVGTQSTVTINECDFTNNTYTGIDLRDSRFTITKSMAAVNRAGGFAFRNKSSGTVEDGGLCENNDFAILAETESSAQLTKVKLISNPNTGVCVRTAAKVTITDCNITKHQNIAVFAENNDTTVTIEKCEFKQNVVGIHADDGATATLTENKFNDNGTHLEVTNFAKGISAQDQYQQSRNGIAANINDHATATFNDCSFFDEAKAAIANAGTAIVDGCTFEDCGVCAIFWHREANGDVRNNKILKNGPCGIQVMKGDINITNNTIEGHSAFGIHIEKGAQASIENNTLGQNTITDVNYEQ